MLLLLKCMIMSITTRCHRQFSFLLWSTDLRRSVPSSPRCTTSAPLRLGVESVPEPCRGRRGGQHRSPRPLFLRVVLYYTVPGSTPEKTTCACWFRRQREDVSSQMHVHVHVDPVPQLLSMFPGPDYNMRVLQLVRLAPVFVVHGSGLRSSGTFRGVAEANTGTPGLFSLASRIET